MQDCSDDTDMIEGLSIDCVRLMACIAGNDSAARQCQHFPCYKITFCAHVPYSRKKYFDKDERIKLAKLLLVRHCDTISESATSTLLPVDCIYLNKGGGHLIRGNFTTCKTSHI